MGFYNSGMEIGVFIYLKQLVSVPKVVDQVLEWDLKYKMLK